MAALAPLVFPQDVPIADPHFHVWDNSTTKNLNLGGIADGPLCTYVSAHYLAAAASLPLAAAVHVETVVGQDGSFTIDSVAETRFVKADTAAFAPRPLGIVAFVHLGQDGVEAELEAHTAAAGAQFVGVRMIMNYSADDKSLTWPQVAHGNYLTGGDAKLNKNFGLLAARGLVFDFHANWFQLSDAAKFFLTQPATSIVIDHLGCPKLGAGADADAETVRVWKAGMGALASLPRVCVKISGLEYVLAGWMKGGSVARTTVTELVHWVVDTFGVDRCMVASNFPVDLHMGGEDLPALYASLYDLLGSSKPGGVNITPAGLRALFHDTAVRVYGLDRLRK